MLPTLVNCESSKEIGEVKCVTPARSSRGQTFNSSWTGLDKLAIILAFALEKLHMPQVTVPVLQLTLLSRMM